MEAIPISVKLKSRNRAHTHTNHSYIHSKELNNLLTKNQLASNYLNNNNEATNTMAIPIMPIYNTRYSPNTG